MRTYERKGKKRQRLMEGKSLNDSKRLSEWKCLQRFILWVDLKEIVYLGKRGAWERKDRIKRIGR